MIKIGVVGGGHIVKHRHIPVFQKLKNAEVTAICDKDELIAKRVAERFNVKKYYTDLSEMLEQPLDVVDICTPPKTHSSLALQAIRQGCHVLMEKPIAMTTGEVDLLYHNARMHNVKLCAVHQNLYNPAVMRARHLVESGRVGDILSVEVGTMIRKENYMSKDGNHWCHRLPGGLFFELLPHPVYLLQIFLKKIQPYGVLAKKRGNYEWIKADELRVLLDGNGGAGLIVGSCNSPFHGDTLNIFGTKMYVQVDLWGRSIIEFRSRSEEPVSVGKANLRYAGQCMKLLGTTVSNSSSMMFNGIKVSAHYGFLEAFVNAIESDGELPVTEEDAKENVRLVGEICKAIDMNSEQLKAA